METNNNVILNVDYNQSLKREFIAESVGGISAQSLKKYLHLFQTYNKTEKLFHKDISDFSQEELKAALESLNLTTVNGFNSEKSVTLKYFKWLAQRGKIDPREMDYLKKIRFEDVSGASVYEKYYFKNISELLTQISYLIEEAGGLDKAEYDTQKASLYLAWYGVKKETLVQIKKAHVSETEGTVLLEQEGRYLFLPENIMSFLRSYKEAKGYYRMMKAEVFMPYKPSEFLIRTNKKTQMDTRLVTAMVNRFSDIDSEKNIHLSYDKIYWSGMFSRAYEYEQINGEILKNKKDLLEKLFRERYSSMAHANMRLKEYQRYKEVFMK